MQKLIKATPRLAKSFSILENVFSLHLFVFFLLYCIAMVLSGLNIPYGSSQYGLQLAMGLLGVSIFRYFFILFFSMLENLKPKFEWNSALDVNGAGRVDFWQRKVSVIMPAFNEDLTIEASIISLAAIKHKQIEIIVVDDGSTDETYKLAKKAATQYPHLVIKVIKKSNGGKASALNRGLREATGEFILCVDADSSVDPLSIGYGLPHFIDPSVAAVGGSIAIQNPNSWILRNQHMEYFLSLNFTRQALSFFGLVTVIPGPIGLFRKSILDKVGGYIEDKDLFAEDAELTIRLLAQGYRTVAEPAMMAVTQGPGNLFDLFRQRYRWKRGLYQALLNNMSSLMKPFGYRKMFLGLWLMLDQLFFEILNFGLSLFFLIYFISRGEVQWPFIWIGLMILMDVVTLFLCCPKKGFWPIWIFHLVIQKISYTLILQMWGILSLLDEWFGVSMSWDKLDREKIDITEPGVTIVSSVAVEDLK